MIRFVTVQAFRVQGWGLEFRVEGSGLRVEELGFLDSFRVSWAVEGFLALGLSFRVWGWGEGFGMEVPYFGTSVFWSAKPQTLSTIGA